MFYAIVALIAMILDQMLKYWTGTNIPLNDTEGPVIIPGLLRLTNLHNTGAAFSLLAGGRFTWFFVLLCIVFVAAVVYALRKETIKTQPARWAAVMVMAGAVGNCADRIINTAADAAGYSHYVVDMFELIPFSFPVFNLADVYITVGAICFCIFTMLEKGDEEIAREEAEAEARGEPVRWNVRRTFAGRPVPEEPEELPEEEPAPEEAEAGEDEDEPPQEAPKIREFREWKVMEGPEVPPDEAEEDGAETDAPRPEPQEAPEPEQKSESAITYSQPQRGPGGDAVFSRISEAVRSVQAGARKPEEAPSAIARGIAESGETPDSEQKEDAAEAEAPPELFSKTEQVVRTLVRGRPITEEPPKANSAPSASGTSSRSSADLSALENESYDLDDILAEFRDQ